MANSGYTSIAVTAYDTLKFSWEITSQSIASNSSVVAWKMELIAGTHGKIVATSTCPWDVTVNGISYSGSVNVGISNNTTKLMASGSTTIAHTSDGTKSFSYSFNQYFGITFSGVWITNKGSSGTGTLDTIPRASSLSGTGGTLGNAHTLKITRASTAFKHRITFNCGDASGYVAGSTTGYTTETSITWTPQISLSWESPNSATVPIKLTLNTYTSDGTYVGTDTMTLSCKVPTDIKPTATLTVEDLTGYLDIYGSLVQGLSKIKATVAGSTAYGSPIATYNLDIGGIQYPAAEATTPELWTSGDVKVVGTVKDKRGRTGSASTSLEVLAYVAPSVSKLSVRRCDEDGTENAQGKFVEVIFSAAVTSLNDKNAAQYVLRYKVTSEEDYTEVSFSDLDGEYTVTDYSYIFPADDNSSYDVQILVKDNHGSATRSTSASTAFAFMDWHSSGTGIAFGKLAEKEDTMEVALTAEFSAPIVQRGNRYSAYIAEGSEDADKAGYDLMARITVTGTYANAPLTFVFTRRNAIMPMTVHFSLANQNDLDPFVQGMGYEGANYGAFLVHAETSVWDLYVARGSGYDFVTLQTWYMSQYMENRVEVSFPGAFASSLPLGAIQIPVAGPQSLLDYIYPVGSIYLTYGYESPEFLFGGTWVQISARVLRAVAIGGTIGGEGTLGSGSGRTYIDIGVWRRTA